MAATGLVAAAAPALASAATPPNVFTKVNLISNQASHHTSLTDPNLKNAWGITAGPTTPIWVSDNNSGKATVYTGGVNGSKVSLELTVPVPGANPTGQVFNSFKGFPVGGASGNPAIFIVDSDSIGSTQSPGQIEAWDGGAKFVVEDSPTGGPGGMTPKGAVFKGLAIANTKAGPELFASDVANATVDIFNSKFAPVSAPGEFTDPRLPAGYAPFGIQALDGKIYVSLRQAERAEDRRDPRGRVRCRRCLQRQRQAAAPPGVQRPEQPAERAVGPGHRPGRLRPVRR